MKRKLFSSFPGVRREGISMIAEAILWTKSIKSIFGFWRNSKQWRSLADDSKLKFKFTKRKPANQQGASFGRHKSSGVFPIISPRTPRSFGRQECWTSFIFSSQIASVSRWLPEHEIPQWPPTSAKNVHLILAFWREKTLSKRFQFNYLLKEFQLQMSFI